MQNRICSLEHECCTQFRKNEKKSKSNKINYKEGVERVNCLLSEMQHVEGFLPNGMRMYNGSGDLEISLPECSNPYDVLIYDAAATKMLQDMSQRLDGRLIVYKDNIDFQGNSYGCHENYYMDKKFLKEDKSKKITTIRPSRFSMPGLRDLRDLTDLIRPSRQNTRSFRVKDSRIDEFYKIYKIIAPFLVSRIIYTGSGHPHDDGFHLTQRAKYITTEISSNSMQDRPILHKRDEPHSSDGIRIHLISNDSNISELSNYLKLGLTDIALFLIERGHLKKQFEIKNSVEVFHEIDKDLSCKKPIQVKSKNYKWLTPIEMQKIYLEKFNTYFQKNPSDSDPITKDVIKRGFEVLAILEDEPMRLYGDIDWVTKKSLIEKYKLSDDYRIKQLCYQYHMIVPPGAYYKEREKLKKTENRSTRIINEQEILNAVENPPIDTRAHARGNLIKQHLEGKLNIVEIDWSYVQIRKGNKTTQIKLDHPFENYSHILEQQSI